MRTLIVYDLFSLQAYEYKKNNWPDINFTRKTRNFVVFLSSNNQSSQLIESLTLVPSCFKMRGGG